MRQIIRQPQAKRDIIAIADYIAESSLNASDRFLQATEKAFKQLAAMPGMGVSREYDNPALSGMRMWPVPGFAKYLIFYSATDEQLNILRVLHGARIWNLFSRRKRSNLQSVASCL